MKQSNTQLSGDLGTIQSVGNLWRIRLDADKHTGTWKIQMASAHPYTLKVTGQTGDTVGFSGLFNSILMYSPCIAPQLQSQRG